MSLSELAPPPLDPIAAQRLQNLKAPVGGLSPWLHEEVGRRMAERLNWIKQRPDGWLDWAPARGGVKAHQQVADQYPQALQWVYEMAPGPLQNSRKALGLSRWSSKRWLKGQKGPDFGLPPDASMGLIWSNMGLHSTADPGAWLSAWHRCLQTHGFLMFSCLGPDTLLELRDLYANLGWPAPAQAFTDMHDWGDMLIEAGFSEPVMDMERIVLTFETPDRLLGELRELGRNLNPLRFQGCRGRSWLADLKKHLQSSGPLELTFEVIYGHAIKPPPRTPMASQAVISLQDMKTALRQKKNSG